MTRWVTNGTTSQPLSRRQKCRSVCQQPDHVKDGGADPAQFSGTGLLIHETSSGQRQGDVLPIEIHLSKVLSISAPDPQSSGMPARKKGTHPRGF